MWSIKWDVLWVCKVQRISWRKVVSSCSIIKPHCIDADTVDAIVTKLGSLE